MLLVVKYDSAPFFDSPPPSTCPRLPLMLDVRLEWGVTSGWISHWSLCHRRAAAALTDSRGLRRFKRLICFSSGKQVIPEAAAALHHAESAGGRGGVGVGVPEWLSSAWPLLAAPGRSWPLFTLDSNAPKYSGGKLSLFMNLYLLCT